MLLVAQLLTNILAAHSKVVTVALFAPLPEDTSMEPLFTERRCIISADSAGQIRVFENQTVTPLTLISI